MSKQHAVSKTGNDAGAVPKQNVVINKNHITISKRSRVMNTTQLIGRGLIALFALFLVAAMAFGQNINLNGSGGTLNGTWNVKGNINTTSASGVYTFSGTTNLSGTGAGTQTIAAGGGATATKAVSFSILNAGPGAGSKDIASGGIVTVSSAFTLNATGKTYSVGANTLNFGGTVTNTSGTFDASDASSVVNYTSGSAQVVFASTYGGTLGLQGGAGATKTFGNSTSAAIVTTAALTPVTVNNPLTITGTSLSTLADLTVNSGQTLDVQGIGGLTITALTANNGGTIQKTTLGGTITFSGNVATAGTITASTGALTFSADADAASGGTISLTGSATANFAQHLTKTGGSLSFGGTSQVNFTGASSQNIAAPISFYNATMSGGGGKTFTGSAQTITFATGGAFANVAETTDFGTNVLSFAGATLSQTTGTVKFGGATNGVIFASGTVDYNAASGDQIIKGHATDRYSILTLSGGGTKTVANADLNVTTDAGLTVSSGVTLVVEGTRTLTVGFTLGDLTLALGSSVTNSGTITVGN